MAMLRYENINTKHVLEGLNIVLDDVVHTNTQLILLAVFREEVKSTTLRGKLFFGSS